ncbi:hypothetical protein AGMMS4956_07750 [Bacteroidia bacterium]|nr:hypothetical protein AGMMS4956_07750 [Bacteroidia bacterium]
MKKLLSVFTALLLVGSASAALSHFVDFNDGGLTAGNLQKGVFAVADIDGDGDLDIIVSGDDDGEKGAVLLNDGAGTFTVQGDPRVITMGIAGGIKFGDIDGDGDLDVIFAGRGGGSAMGIALNDGAGVFTLAATSDYPQHSDGNMSCGFADFNNDGLLDYWFFGNGVNNCAIYFQQLDGSFVKDISSFGGFNFFEPGVTVIDFNNDGYMDIVVQGNDAGTVTRYVGIFLNDGYGAFTLSAQPNVIPKGNGTVSWGDFNGDGFPDMLLNGDGWLGSGEDNDGIVRLYKNNNGTLEVARIFEPYRQNSMDNGTRIVDWDNDGDLDIIIAGWNPTKDRQATDLFLCTDPANFTFTEDALGDTYLPSVSEQSLEVADLNADGKADLMLMGFSNGIGSYGRRITGYVPNNTANASVPPDAPTNLARSEAFVNNRSVSTFSWTAPASEAAKMGTTYNLALKNISTGKWLYNPMAIIAADATNGWRQVTGAGNVGGAITWELYNLPTGDYEWTVQAINGAYTGGAFAATLSFTVPPPHLYFNANGGSVGTASKQVTYKAVVGELPIPTLTDNFFNGWNTAQDGTGETYTAATVYNKTVSNTVYAQWIYRENGAYVLLFNNNGGTGGREYQYLNTITGNIDSLPAPTRTGYTLSGWNTLQDGSGAVYTTGGTFNTDTTLYAQWTANVYKLFLDANTGAFAGGKLMDTLDVTYDAAVGTLPAPTRAAYLFTEWNTAQDGSGLTCTATTIYPLPSNITLYAQWQERTTPFANNFSELDIQQGDIAVGDIDGDGKLDIIVSGVSGTVEKGAVLLGKGDGTFDKANDERIIKIGKAGGIKFGDIDGDGDLDVIFAGWGATSSAIGIALNDGTGRFTLADASAYPRHSSGNMSCGFADFNMDGLLDYYFFGNGVHKCVLYLQQPAGTFVADTLLVEDKNLVEPQGSIIDFNNDGWIDIVIQAFDDTGNERYTAVFTNDGWGHFTKMSQPNLKPRANGTISWGDFNNDGFPDMVLNGDNGAKANDEEREIRIYKNNGGTTLEQVAEFSLYRQGSMYNGTAVVDWDGDGNLDLIVGGWNPTMGRQATSLFRCTNPTNFTFVEDQTWGNATPGVSEQAYEIADLNSDGKPDLLMMGYSTPYNQNIFGWVLNTSANASTKPAAPTGLKTQVGTDADAVKFTWVAPSSEAAKIGTTYNLSIKNTTTGKWVYNPMAITADGATNGWRKVTGAGNMGLTKTYELYGLPDGNYEWTVQAINGAYMGGTFAPTQTFTIAGGVWTSGTGTEPEDPGDPQGPTAVGSTDANPTLVYAVDKNIIIHSSESVTQTAEVFNTAGSLIATKTFAVDTEIYIAETGLYIVKITPVGKASTAVKVIVR